MTKIKNIETIDDDFEVLDILSKIPAFPAGQFKGKTIINLIDESGFDKDFGMTFPFEREFLLIYKIGLKQDSGLMLIKAKFEHSDELVSTMYLSNLFFPNKTIAQSMFDDLISFCVLFGLKP